MSSGYIKEELLVFITLPLTRRPCSTIGSSILFLGFPLEEIYGERLSLMGNLSRSTASSVRWLSKITSRTSKTK